MLVRVLSYLLIPIFIISAATLVVVRATGYHSETANGRFYLDSHGYKNEVTKEEFDDARQRERIGEIAAITMAGSLVAFGLLEPVRRWKQITLFGSRATSSP